MKIKAILLPTLALLMICVVVTAALSFTNRLTKDTIAQQNQQKITQTMELLVPGATFEQVNDTTYIATQNGTVTYVFLTQAMGYKSKVEVMTAIDQNGTVLGVSVVNCSEESPGIGQKVGTDQDFLNGFQGKTDDIDGVDGITGATYSANAVKEAVKEALTLFHALNTVTPTSLAGGAQ